MEDGGQAFPGVEHRATRDGDHVEHWAESWSGMSLRDYFAAAALQGMLANPNIKSTVEFAPMAWKLADNMLKRRGDK
jgi:hypothetical protein